MSYRQDLDEMSMEKLTHEISMRLRRQRDGRCDYCARFPTDPTCRFPDRHMRDVPDNRLTQVGITADRVVEFINGVERHTITDPHEIPSAQR